MFLLRRRRCGEVIQARQLPGACAGAPEGPPRAPASETVLLASRVVSTRPASPSRSEPRHLSNMTSAALVRHSPHRWFLAPGSLSLVVHLLQSVDRRRHAVHAGPSAAATGTANSGATGADCRHGTTALPAASASTCCAARLPRDRDPWWCSEPRPQHFADLVGDLAARSGPPPSRSSSHSRWHRR